MGDTGGDRVSGGAGDDTITGAAGGDTLTGEGGDDVVMGGFGSDRIEGGAGDDVLDGANDQDIVLGGPGDDLIHGGSGQDLVEGGPGNDRLYSDSGAGAVFGGDGDDVIVVQDSDGIKVVCGAGQDTLYVAQPAGVADDLITRDFSIPRRAQGCERVLLTDDVPDPNQGLKYLATDAGGAKDGTAKDDLLLGGPGEDRLRGFSGNDVLWGLRQAGVTSPAPDTLDAGPGEDTIYGGQGPQRISAGAGDDFVNGGLGPNTISGGSGEDTIRLRGDGLNTVDAGPGNDTVYAAGPARARVRCGPGRDTVYASVNDAVAKDCETVTSGRAGRPGRLRADESPPPAATPDTSSYAALVRSTPGLLHRWRMNDKSDYELLDDVTGRNGYGGGRPEEQGATDDGDAAWLVTPGGFNPQVYATAPRELPASTLELWVRTGLRPGPAEVVASHRGSADPASRGSGYTVLALAGGRFQATLVAQDGATTTLLTPPSARPVDGWHHIALARDGTTATLYVDGEAAATGQDRDLRLRPTYSAEGYHYGAAAFAFGDLAYNAFERGRLDGPVPADAPQPLSGALDEIAIYDRALDTATVREHARFGEGAPPPTTSLAFPIPDRIGARFDAFLVSERGSTRFRCQIDGAAIELPCRPRLSITLPTGPHTLRIRAVDRFGVTETDPKTYSFTVDSTLPRTFVLAKVGRIGDSGTVVAFSSDDPAATFRCRRAGRFGITTIPAGETADGEGYTPCRSPLEMTGAETRLEVRAVDGIGNRDPTPAVVEFEPAFGSVQPLPALAGARADAIIGSDLGPGYAALSCRLDGGPASACSSPFRLPVVDAGTHTLTATQTDPGGSLSATVRWTVTPAPAAGTVELAALQFPAVVESAVQLLRRVPRVRFVLGSAAKVALTVRNAAGAVVGTANVEGTAGANTLKLPAAGLRGLRLGRYTLTISAQGPSGPASAQAVPFALIPRTR